MISFTTTSLKQLHCHEKKTNETPQKVDHHRNCNYQSQRWSSDTHRLSASQSVIRACAVHTQSFISSKQKRADLWRRCRCFFSWLFQKSSWTLKQRMSLWYSVAVLVVDAEVGVVSESVFHTWTIAYVSHTNLFFIAMVKVKMGYIHGRLWSWEFLYRVDSSSCKI